MSALTNMSMEQLRGRVPMDINQHNNFNENQRVEMDRWREKSYENTYGRQNANSYNLHHNKNHNIFDDPSAVQNPYAQYGRMRAADEDDQIQKAVAFVQAANPNAVGSGLEETLENLKREQRASPGKSKNKLGALYNPNYVDPRIIPIKRTSPGSPAGVKTNYGVSVPTSVS